MESVSRRCRGARLTSSDVSSVRQQDPCFFGVRQVRPDHLLKYLVGKLRTTQVEHHFDALVDISMHPVGASEIQLGLPAVSENKNSAMFQKASDHAAHAYAAADAAHTGAQRACPAH